MGQTTGCVSKGGVPIVVRNPHVCVFVFRVHADAYPGHPIIRGNGVTLLSLYLHFIVNTRVDIASERCSNQPRGK